MKKNTLLGLTIISCIGVVFAVIFDDKIEETENPTDEEIAILDEEEIIDLDVAKEQLVASEKAKILNMYSLSHYDTLRRTIAINYY